MTEHSPDHARMIKKIAAILAKANSTTFEGEALSLAEKARKLMAENGIDMLSVETADDPLGRDTNDDTTKVRARWETDLLESIALFYGAATSFVRFRDGVYRVWIYGRLSARIMVREMWPYFRREVSRQASQLRSTGRTRKSHKVAARLIGAALAERILYIVHERRHFSTDAAASNGLSLVVADAATALRDQDVTRIAGTTTTDFDLEAIRAADRISLDEQITTSQSETLLLEEGFVINEVRA